MQILVRKASKDLSTGNGCLSWPVLTITTCIWYSLRLFQTFTWISNWNIFIALDGNTFNLWRQSFMILRWSLFLLLVSFHRIIVTLFQCSAVSKCFVLSYLYEKSCWGTETAFIANCGTNCVTNNHVHW